jgi:hypothetical protein
VHFDNGLWRNREACPANVREYELDLEAGKLA